MVNANELISIINKFSLKERLLIVEEILRDIRREETLSATTQSSKPQILELAGIIDDETAASFSEAVKESRKIDENEW